MKFAYFACRLRHVSVTGSAFGMVWIPFLLVVKVLLPLFLVLFYFRKVFGQRKRNTCGHGVYT